MVFDIFDKNCSTFAFPNQFNIGTFPFKLSLRGMIFDLVLRFKIFFEKIFPVKKVFFFSKSEKIIGIYLEMGHLNKLINIKSYKTFFRVKTKIYEIVRSISYT